MNNSKTVFKEPIYRLDTQNPITHGIGIWQGTRNNDGQISLEQYVKKYSFLEIYLVEFLELIQQNQWKNFY